MGRFSVGRFRDELDFGYGVSPGRFLHRRRSFILDEGTIGQEWRGIFPLHVICGIFPLFPPGSSW
jgi:hypothetical protein